MVLSKKKLNQKIRAAKSELIAASEAGNNLTDKNYEKSLDLDSKTLILNLEAQKPRFFKRGKQRRKAPKESAEVTRNGEMSGHVEPQKQGGSNSDAMQLKTKNRKRKRDESEVSESGKQLKKKKKKQKKKKPKKKVENGEVQEVENGEVQEEGIHHNDRGSTGEQFVVKTSESIERKNVETSLKVYVGGIPYYSTEDDIRSYFEGCGTITSVDSMTFPDTGKFRGIAIITFKTEAAAKRALALDGSDMGGLFLKIQPFKSARSNKFPMFSPSALDGYNRIYVGNLSWDITEDDLRKLFADCTVSSIRFGEDKDTGEFKGYAHVDFADNLSLSTALKLDQTVIYGRPVRISCAVPKKGTETKKISTPKDNQVNSGKKGNATMLEVTAKDNRVNCGDVGAIVENQISSVGANAVGAVVENQISSSVANAVSSKIRRRMCYECGERGHLSSTCPKKLAADSTNQGTA